MLEYDKLYTVEDVAQRTGLTDRTIRNYLKDGKLRGKKIGGQWRFTADDIEALFRTPGEERKSGASEELFASPCAQMNPDVYTVVEYECEQTVAGELSARIRAEIDNPENSFRGSSFDYIYNEKEKRARFVLRGGADFVASMLKIIRKQAKKGI